MHLLFVYLTISLVTLCCLGVLGISLSIWIKKVYNVHSKGNSKHGRRKKWLNSAEKCSTIYVSFNGPKWETKIASVFFLYFKTLEWFKKVYPKNWKKENNETECIVMLTQLWLPKKPSNTITISISTVTMDATMPMHSVNRIKTIVVYDMRWSRQCNFQQWKCNGAASLDEWKNVHWNVKYQQMCDAQCTKAARNSQQHNDIARKRDEKLSLKKTARTQSFFSEPITEVFKYVQHNR